VAPRVGLPNRRIECTFTRSTRRTTHRPRDDPRRIRIVGGGSCFFSRTAEFRRTPRFGESTLLYVTPTAYRRFRMLPIHRAGGHSLGAFMTQSTVLGSIASMHFTEISKQSARRASTCCGDARRQVQWTAQHGPREDVICCPATSAPRHREGRLFSSERDHLLDPNKSEAAGVTSDARARAIASPSAVRSPRGIDRTSGPSWPLSWFSRSGRVPALGPPAA